MRTVGERDDDVGGVGPLGDDADPNTLHECATCVGEGIIGISALPQLDENIATFVRVARPQRGGRRCQHQCDNGHC
jgi:hypothetical protein